ncbi:MAG: HAD family hydrolase [Pseudomonadota bacterium]
MADLAPPRHILFDWDNTLVDSASTIQRAFTRALEQAGLDVDTFLEARNAMPYSSNRVMFPVLFGPRSEELQTYYHNAYACHHLEMLRPFEGIEAMLDDLAKAGIECSVISNKTHYFLEKEIDQLGWNGRFKGFVGAGQAASDKPDKAHFLTHCRRFCLNPDQAEEFWYVGDSEVDLQFANVTGMKSIIIDHQSQERTAQDFQHQGFQHQADRLIHRPFEIMQLVSGTVQVH